MCKNAVFILHFCSSRGPVSLKKEKPRKPLKSMAATKNTPLSHNGNATCATLPRLCRYSKIACAFGAAAPAAIFAGV